VPAGPIRRAPTPPRKAITDDAAKAQAAFAAEGTLVGVTEVDLDYVAFSGRKLYAPYDAGCLVGRADWPRAAPPYLYGGGATAEVGADSVSWAADAFAALSGAGRGEREPHAADLAGATV
jgi:selenocysteine lyase/cysteine desulfurase